MSKHATHPEPHTAGSGGTLNRLRAAVLGANDGIVSVASIIVGVAGATNARGTIITAGIAALVAGALSMAGGEYISVSSQRDTERALLAKEELELATYPAEELAELAGLYQAKGLSHTTAQLVAKELTQHDAYAAHVDAELGIDPNDLTNPWQAAIASAVSFFLGAAIPLLAVLVSPVGLRIPVTFGAVVVALLLTGILGAKAGQAPVGRATIRVVAGGILAMLVTYGVGKLTGHAGV
jgi:VIT1/CCC1 family predicted Fe2+/Mn2+ transporter